MSDYESVVAAVEEAQRILAAYDEAATEKNQHDFVAMLQFILCNPSVTVAIGRLKQRS
jgi:aryl-alcohol dehydrogenase-like predicted oxidoreductase